VLVVVGVVVVVVVVVMSQVLANTFHDNDELYILVICINQNFHGKRTQEYALNRENIKLVDCSDNRPPTTKI
jgi:hypothetical protein